MDEKPEPQRQPLSAGTARLYYLDWLRVIAILMVFLFHAVHPFDLTDWQVKNAEQSEFLTIILQLLGIWGMPFFFLVAGAGSWFALQKRTSGQYLRERFNRLLVPFIAGTLLFSPIEYYCEGMNRVQRGVLTSFPSFFSMFTEFDPSLLRFPGFSPKWFGLGFHLWFLGFLFSFALITVPLFQWLKREAGQRMVSRLVTICERRAGILWFAVPLAVVDCLLDPFASEDHDWADFVFQLSFFVLGYVLFANPRFANIIRRDGRVLLTVPTVIVLVMVTTYLAGLPAVEWSETPGILPYYVLRLMGAAIALGYSLAMVNVGMRFLNFTNRWLQTAQEAALPFFVLHQPVIIVIAYYVVQWQAGIAIKLPIVVLSSFAISIGLYEYLVRRIRLLRRFFGMKDRPPEKHRVAFNG